MNSKTFDRLVGDLCQQIKEHKHKDEVLSLAVAQLLDDDVSFHVLQDTFETLWCSFSHRRHCRLRCLAQREWIVLPLRQACATLMFPRAPLWNQSASRSKQISPVYWTWSRLSVFLMSRCLPRLSLVFSSLLPMTVALRKRCKRNSAYLLLVVHVTQHG